MEGGKGERVRVGEERRIIIHGRVDDEWPRVVRPLRQPGRRNFVP